MLPDRCSITESGKQCPNPPESVISVVHKNDEYMVGVTCDKHKHVVTVKIKDMQRQGVVPDGKVRFVKLKAVGTDCIKGNADDYIQIDHDSPSK